MKSSMLTMKDAEIAVKEGLLDKSKTRKEECVEGTKIVLNGITKKKSQKTINKQLKKLKLSHDEHFICWCMAGQFIEDRTKGKINIKDEDI